eukprot:7036941-Alexandrium_andersonii.AAC.1
MSPGPGATHLLAGPGSVGDGLSNGAPLVAATGPLLHWYTLAVLAIRSLPTTLPKSCRSTWRNLARAFALTAAVPPARRE